MTDEELRERIAALEHEQWSYWTRYFQGKLKEIIEYEAGPAVWNRIEADPVMQRWKRQIETPYADLSEQEKDSDREWADKVLALIQRAEGREVSDD